MTKLELAAADAWAIGVTPGIHPIQFVRERLADLGALRVIDFADVEDGTRIRVGGAVTHRQRPVTASGITFLNLEDETGMLNVVVEQKHLVSLPNHRPSQLSPARARQSSNAPPKASSASAPTASMTIQHASRDFR